MTVETSAVPLVLPDVVIDALIADGRQFRLAVFHPAADLLWAPVQQQLLIHECDNLGRHLRLPPPLRPSALVRKLLRQMVIIFPINRVSSTLTAYRGSVDTDF